MRAYIVEPQGIFVPAITSVLLDAGLEIANASVRLDFRELLELSPELVFADFDFMPGEPGQAIRIMRSLLPDGIICVYTEYCDSSWQRQFSTWGASRVLAKTASHEELVEDVRQLVFGAS